MSILEELQQLRKERAEKAPFSSFLEFEEWADAVLPLISFHEPTEQEFSEILTRAGVTHRMGSHEDANTNMNMAVGVLNQAIKRAEIQERANTLPQIGFENLLHPVIVGSSLELYANGHLRESVLNAIIAVFDLIRERTGVEDDGDRLIGQVMSINNPLLVLSELESESGQNDQKGFMQIFKGAYQGIRNPKAHTLNHDLNEMKAAQYLVFASMLARRVDEANA
ncbi:TIGR02391 family protein [Ferrimonas sp.]|uniref:TIGR02391 family protein n=1 Tax=Ferrimonas sp. TaxID=2080861 RepID=UPI003A933056